MALFYVPKSKLIWRIWMCNIRIENSLCLRRCSTKYGSNQFETSNYRCKFYVIDLYIRKERKFKELYRGIVGVRLRTNIVPVVDIER